MSDRKTRYTLQAVHRRDALKGLGALMLAAPSLAATRCGGSDQAAATSSDAAAAGATGDTGTAAVSSTAARAGSGAVSGSAASSVSSASAGRSAPASAQSNVGGSPAAMTSTSTSTAPAATGGAGSPAAASGGATAVAGASGAPSQAAAGSAGSAASADFIPVMFDAAASCTLTPTDPAGEGPFFIHDSEVMDDVSLIRADMSEGKPGVELQLNIRVLDSDGMCMKPIAGVEVYTWHTDASGFYSGFANQDPDQPYTGGGERTVENMDRFCRGIQISDEQGVVRFKTVFPGWYNGRAIHIHFLALRPGSGPGTMSYRSKQYMVFTTQMYFAESFSRMLHESHDPYKARASGMAYNTYVKPQNMTVNPSMHMQGDIAVGAINIVTAGTGSRR